MARWRRRRPRAFGHSVNEHPELRDIVQFNGKMLPCAAPVGVGYQQFVKPDDEKPVPAGRLHEVGR